MYDGQVKVPMVVRSMIGKSWGQGAQHWQGLHSMFMHVPGLKVVAPSNAHDAKGCMIAAIRDDNPVIFVEHRLLVLSPKLLCPKNLTSWRSARRGSAPQAMTSPWLAFPTCWWSACARTNCSARSAIAAEVIDPVSLVPLDIDTIVNSVDEDRPPAGGRQCLDELRRKRRDRRAGDRARAERQADLSSADGLCADHVSDHAGAGAGVLSRPGQNRASGPCHGPSGDKPGSRMPSAPSLPTRSNSADRSEAASRPSLRASHVL